MSGQTAKAGCPHVVTGDEGTSHCTLAETEVRRLRAEVDHWKQVAAERQEALDWWAATSAKPEVTP